MCISFMLNRQEAERLAHAIKIEVRYSIYNVCIHNVIYAYMYM